MIAQEGVLAIGSNDIYIAPAKTASTITKIVFNCAVAYDILLEIYRATGPTTNTVYDLSLNAGDTVIDSSVYYFNPGDKLIATTNAVVSYNIMGIDTPNPPAPPFIYNQ